MRSRQDGAGRKFPRLDELDDVIVTNQCYQAFDEDVEMEAGTEWVQCVCARWLHEDFHY